MSFAELQCFTEQSATLAEKGQYGCLVKMMVDQIFFFSLVKRRRTKITNKTISDKYINIGIYTGIIHNIAKSTEISFFKLSPSPTLSTEMLLLKRAAVCSALGVYLRKEIESISGVVHLRRWLCNLNNSAVELLHCVNTAEDKPSSLYTFITSHVTLNIIHSLELKGANRKELNDSDSFTIFCSTFSTTKLPSNES